LFRESWGGKKKQKGTKITTICPIFSTRPL